MDKTMSKYIQIFLIIFIVLTSFLQAQNAEKEESVNGPLIQFAEEKYDFKQVVEGDNVSHLFKFTNAGNDTLKIKRVDGG